MGILLPAMVPLAYQLSASGQSLAVIMTFGAVLDGAIFGDHCSPISDTTVMSSMAASVDHLEHVRTQIPYALTTMGVSAACGYLPVAFGMPVWVAYGVGVVGGGGVVGVVGKRTEGTADERTGG
jgi:Na+/H+ antiporter NhaC